MPRVKRGVVRRAKRKKLSKLTKGYFQNKSKLYKFMKEAAEKAGVYAYVGRKRKKRDYRSLWIVRINAAAREHGMSYSVFMNGLKTAGISSIARASPSSRRASRRRLPRSSSKVKAANPDLNPEPRTSNLEPRRPRERTLSRPFLYHHGAMMTTIDPSVGTDRARVLFDEELNGAGTDAALQALRTAGWRARAAGWRRSWSASASATPEEKRRSVAAPTS